MRRVIFTISAIVLAALGCAQIASAAGAAATGIDPVAQRYKAVEELESGDDARVQPVLQSIQAYIKRHRSAKADAAAMQPLLDAHRYADLDSIALAQIISDAGNTGCVAALEKLRAQAFVAAGRAKAALGAGKGYYNVAPLELTADSLDVMGTCLAAANPSDPTIADRFKEQQVAWLTAAPTSQPDASPDPGLGQPILAGISCDATPFEAAIAAAPETNYARLLAKGNLLLLAGKEAEARKVFERGVEIAPENKLGEAYGNVARAIRAESGCIAPANAYIAGVRGGH